MKLLLAGVVGLVVVVAVTAGVVLGLDDDDSPNSSRVSGDSPSPVRCTELIPDEAVAALGWDGATEAREHAGRCERSGSKSGRITVGTRALAASGEDRSEALADEYDARCTALGDAATAEQSPSWLTSDNHACAALPDRGLGVAQMFVLLDDDLVQIRIESLEPVEDPQLHDSLNMLVEAAAGVY